LDDRGIVLFTFWGHRRPVFFRGAFMSLFKFLAAPVRRALRVVFALFMPKSTGFKPGAEGLALPRLSTRVAGPREPR